jgi:hypothetical protein
LMYRFLVERCHVSYSYLFLVFVSMQLLTGCMTIIDTFFSGGVEPGIAERAEFQD